MLRSSIISLAAKGIKLHIAENTEIKNQDIYLGHPTHINLQASENDELTLYFYQISESGNSSYVPPQKLELEVNIYCLITAFGGTRDSDGVGDEGISSGESDLNILGQVMECLHEYPLLDVKFDEKYYRIEITPVSLSIDDLSKIVPVAPAHCGFRPSIAYALSTIPLRYTGEPQEAPAVNILSYQAEPNLNNKDSEIFGGNNKVLDNALSKSKIIDNSYFDTVTLGNRLILQFVVRPNYFPIKIHDKDFNGELDFFIRKKVNESNFDQILLLTIPPLNNFTNNEHNLVDEDLVEISENLWSEETEEYIEVKKQFAIWKSDSWQVQPGSNWQNVSSTKARTIFAVPWNIGIPFSAQRSFQARHIRPGNDHWLNLNAPNENSTPSDLEKFDKRMRDTHSNSCVLITYEGLDRAP